VSRYTGQWRCDGLSEPASAMIGRRSAAVLRALARTDAVHTGRQMARMAEVSPSQTARVLQQLAEHGLLLVEEQGSGNLYRLNREHLAAEALAHLALLRQRLLTRYWPPRSAPGRSPDPRIAVRIGCPRGRRYRQRPGHPSPPARGRG
jgi:DNA-binding transcriptional ArsR family regulator